jgi:DNA-binding MarR family transcriptional regulator
VTTDQAIERIQFCYPQIYYACHTRHARKRSSTAQLSARDSQLLVHLDRTAPMTLTTLARHMDLSASTLSEAVSKLEALGYLTKAVRQGTDRRRVGLLLTAKGVGAVRATSVLEPDRLRAVLGRLSKRDVALVIGGLSRFAEACRPVLAGKRDSGEHETSLTRETKTNGRSR